MLANTGECYGDRGPYLGADQLWSPLPRALGGLSGMILWWRSVLSVQAGRLNHWLSKDYSHWSVPLPGRASGWVTKQAESQGTSSGVEEGEGRWLYPPWAKAVIYTLLTLNDAMQNQIKQVYNETCVICEQQKASCGWLWECKQLWKTRNLLKSNSWQKQLLVFQAWYWSHNSVYILVLIVCTEIEVPVNHFHLLTVICKHYNSGNRAHLLFLHWACMEHYRSTTVWSTTDFERTFVLFQLAYRQRSLKLLV